MKVMTIYDDTGRKSDVIRDIIGEKGFSDVVVKKRRLEEYYYEFIEKIYPDVEWKTIHSTSEYFGSNKVVGVMCGNQCSYFACILQLYSF